VSDHPTKVRLKNGDIYGGELVQEDEHRVWIRDGNGKTWQIMKLDIVAQTR
jgi:hypothetical protein